MDYAKLHHRAIWIAIMEVSAKSYSNSRLSALQRTGFEASSRYECSLVPRPSICGGGRGKEKAWYRLHCACAKISVNFAVYVSVYVQAAGVHAHGEDSRRKYPDIHKNKRQK